MVVVEEQDDYYYSDSDSDDEDVDRYVFLARQPEGRHAEDDDRDASSANDNDNGGDGKTGEEESEGGVGKRKKRLLRDILADDDAPQPTKKAQLELIIASPLAARMTPPSGSESNLSSSAGESGSEGSHEKAHEHRAPIPGEQGEAENTTKKKRAACGKRIRSPGSEADGDRDDVAAAAVAKTAGASSGATAASGRFPCSLCDRCFGSHQALGGHVLGHRKRTKIAIAAAAILDADDAGGKANGDGSSSDEGKTVDDAAEHGDEDVDRARHKRQRKVHGKGNGGVLKPVFAGSHGDADANGNDGFVNMCNPNGVSGHGFTDGNSGSDDGKMDIGRGTASPNRKVGGAGTCHEGANGNGNVCTTRYKCKVCGKECLTGRALGGHMRKHRKRPPVGGGGGEERSPSPATDDDCQIPLAQLYGAETILQR